ncbi:hypothetical protein BJX66DRAFT_339133 [Aspergillus keveii]|uniref:DUF7703 domain-containing protein n=1 Tax=Aspergillus keveii TaxID=714993 RepID=A0ABR4G239_9EURO
MTITFDRTLCVFMMMAAFTGIAWYIGVEINISLFLVFKRQGRGLYFWSCALVSWGVALHANFNVWNKDQLVPSIILIYLTWIMMVVPQSWVLYSRLHLIMSNDRLLGQTTSIKPHLPAINLAWGRAELAVFFIQETALSVLYIYKIKQYICERAQLHQLIATTRNHQDADQDPSVLRQLVYANAFIIGLDVVLLVIHCLGMFHLQGTLKPCVYGIKLKVEFVILNRLRDGVRRLASGRVWLGSGPDTELANGNEAGTGAVTCTRGSETMTSSGWYGSFYVP